MIFHRTRFRASFKILILLLAFLPAGLAQAQAPAQGNGPDVRTTWRLLDYIAVDYPAAIQDGRIVSEAEYAEMGEFSATVAGQLAALPAGPQRAVLLVQSDALRAAIAAKAAPAEVERIARRLAADLLKAHPVPLAPPAIPDLARGAASYSQNCAACHGMTGLADDPVNKAMDPAPIAFADKERAKERSIFALYQVIDQGLEGTAMQSYAHLPAEEKWALAFHAGRFAYPERLAAQGKQIWEADAALRARIPDLATLVSLTPVALAREIGAAKVDPVIAYLRSHPEVVATSDTGSLDIAREKLRQSLAAYEAGDRAMAEKLALAAYLDGFEPVEPVLSARDPGLMTRVERAMAELRAAIGRERPAAEVRGRIEDLDSLFDEAETALSPESGSWTSTFVGAFMILLREGLEALLIVIGMLAFLRKADRPEMIRPVHYGWASALVAGIATWWAATHLITVSGADRELTEGFGSLLAALILLFVGIWMHGKAQADEWQNYIKAKVGQALSRRSGWFLFGLAFIAVYREVFETILFYTAMAAQGAEGALLAGAAVAALCLALIAVAMIRFSRRLPIAKFFGYSSALIAVLAVVLAGKGVAALQEAGMIDVTPIAGVPTISILGLSPTVESIMAQIVTLIILIAGFAYNRREKRSVAVA